MILCQTVLDILEGLFVYFQLLTRLLLAASAVSTLINQLLVTLCASKVFLLSRPYDGYLSGFRESSTTRTRLLGMIIVGQNYIHQLSVHPDWRTVGPYAWCYDMQVHIDAAAVAQFINLHWQQSL